MTDIELTLLCVYAAGMLLGYIVRDRLLLQRAAQWWSDRKRERLASRTTEP